MGLESSSGAGEQHCVGLEGPLRTGVTTGLCCVPWPSWNRAIPIPVPSQERPWLSQGCGGAQWKGSWP